MVLSAGLGVGFEGGVVFSEGFGGGGGFGLVGFDFDGTLSLLREGWGEVMVGMFLEFLPRVDGGSLEEDEGLLWEDVMGLNGRQTVYQMLRFVERVRERGGVPRDALWYKWEFLRRLGERIGGRLERLEGGGWEGDEFLVFGARGFLEGLRGLGVPLFLVSGTDEVFVRREAELLGIADFFEGRIFGAVDDYRSFSKGLVMERLLGEFGLVGGDLLSFGDGFVEVEVTKGLGGVAVGVASDEGGNGSGRLDEWKVRRLLGAGADVVVGDYRDGGRLLELLWGGGG